MNDTKKLSRFFHIFDVSPAQCDHIWRNFATWAKNFKFGHYLEFDKNLILLWQNFIVAEGQIILK